MKTITIESIKTAIDSDEVFDKACDHFRAACGYPTKEEVTEAEQYDTWIEPEELANYLTVYNAAFGASADANGASAESMKKAHEDALVAALQAFYKNMYRRDSHRCAGEIRHAMGHVFQDVIKPEVLGIPCEACTPTK